MKTQLLGRYETGKLLGHGSFGKVYHARNVNTNESVAIKVLDKAKILKIGMMAHIKREISILHRVRHPNIVRLYEVMATKSKIYFVMELVKGGELFRKVANGRMREDVARKYFQQLISAVRFCHAQGVFHRDLKPENLLVDENGDLKVSDFGLCAVSDQIRKDGLFHTFCGTPAYVAPEVLSGKGYYGATADVWSCGVILFVLTAGFLPFHDQNVMAMYRKIYRGEFRCPKWFSGELSRLLSRILDTNPRTRIRVADLMGNRWFKKEVKRVRYDSVTVSEEELCVGLGRVRLNAFDIISFSTGFDLSGLFGEGREERRFVSGEPVTKIVGKLEEIGKVAGRFRVWKKERRVGLEGRREGEKGRLRVVAEIFELTAELVVVEVKKEGGDEGEYEDFLNRELKPGLENLLYSESSTAANLTPCMEYKMESM
ncbi:CBL-interacting serine/threonine-protein kinase 12-like protein [Cinnamomum micranthum f. kanehirae]|uniref:non-specific serine/threonine protein kinase n=1 Tax=Cinnamomum micranthum f. kanehirae TaxID=337451 RepID=A0A443P6T1_9MAGN|nr:CBL-interacting serine/threonine-protein kinase 12-like protein [Cinnamomum micranthum f. kanehirae]